MAKVPVEYQREQTNTEVTSLQMWQEEVSSSCRTGAYFWRGKKGCVLADDSYLTVYYVAMTSGSDMFVSYC